MRASLARLASVRTSSRAVVAELLADDDTDANADGLDGAEGPERLVELALAALAAALAVAAGFDTGTLGETAEAPPGTPLGAVVLPAGGALAAAVAAAMVAAAAALFVASVALVSAARTCAAVCGRPAAVGAAVAADVPAAVTPADPAVVEGGVVPTFASAFLAAASAAARAKPCGDKVTRVL
ncbi:hypothetical protein GH865_11315 [Rhodocyclus tenuis]|uniref:hypothetical protein n=1 Tax=Rhodocyclus gracilis TaxID=2929842 RepID=UPI001298AEC5|nr:hypothetical protein [Rhodocyclus gracilis]MRD73833.1 hypothetical protein [Rhodocyclus gracilis]